jgi:hypothetical protein
MAFISTSFESYGCPPSALAFQLLAWSCDGILRQFNDEVLQTPCTRSEYPQRSPPFSSGVGNWYR